MKNLTVVELKPFVPAKDYELSKRFYLAMGFTLASDNEGIAYFHHESVSFLLQRSEEHKVAVNLTLHLLVEDVDAWWLNLNDAGIAGEYGVTITDVQQRPWRMRDFHLVDPAGVVWIIGQNTD